MIPMLVAAVAAFIFAAIWFTFLFGKTWAKLMNFGDADITKESSGMAKPMVMNFVVTFLSAWSVSTLVSKIPTLSFVDFLVTALIVWIGFSFPIYANAAIWERKSWKLVLINSAHSLIFFTIISAIVFNWR